MVDIVEDMVLFDFLSGNSSLTYYCYTRLAKFLFQHPNILNIIENIDGEEMGSRTLSTLHLHDETFFSSRSGERTFLVRDASQYVQNQTKHHLFYAPSFYKSEKGLLREFHVLYQEHDTASGPFICAPLRAATSATETATVKQVFFIIMRLYAYDPCDEMERWSRHSDQRQQRLNRSVEKFLASTTPA